MNNTLFNPLDQDLGSTSYALSTASVVVIAINVGLFVIVYAVQWCSGKRTKITKKNWETKQLLQK